MSQNETARDGESENGSVALQVTVYIRLDCACSVSHPKAKAKRGYKKTCSFFSAGIFMGHTVCFKHVKYGVMAAPCGRLSFLQKRKGESRSSCRRPSTALLPAVAERRKSLFLQEVKYGNNAIYAAEAVSSIYNTLHGRSHSFYSSRLAEIPHSYSIRRAQVTPS